jgi:hypothetical protein
LPRFTEYKHPTGTREGQLALTLRIVFAVNELETPDNGTLLATLDKLRWKQTRSNAFFTTFLV